MCFDTYTTITTLRGAILFQRFRPKSWIAGALQRHLHEFFKVGAAGDEESARRLIENLNPSSVGNAENLDLAKLPKDILGTSLIPDIHVLCLSAVKGGKK